MRRTLAITALLLASVAPASAQYRAVTVDTSAIAAAGCVNTDVALFARAGAAAPAAAVACATSCTTTGRAPTK